VYCARRDAATRTERRLPCSYKFRQQRHEQVEPLLVDALPTLQDILGPDHYVPRRVLQTIVELYDSWGKPDRAAFCRSMIPEPD